MSHVAQQKVVGGDCPKCAPKKTNTLWLSPCPMASTLHEHYCCDHCGFEYVWNPSQQEWLRYNKRGEAIEIFPKREVGVLDGAAPHRGGARPVLRYYGGKFRLAERIIRLFPPHKIYTEGFGGAASILLRKPRCHAEIYNDLDGEVVNVFRVLQCKAHAARLERLLRVTPFSRAEFEKSYRHSKNAIERARRTIIRSFMGFGSDSITRMKASAAGFNTRISTNGTMRTGFRGSSLRSNTTPAVDWMRYPEAIRQFTERLQGVILENRSAIEVIRKADRLEALHYVDPPYPHSERRDRVNGHSHGRARNYRHEMTDIEHESLAEALHGLKGMVMISSYPGPLYARLYADWKSVDWTGQQFCHGGAKRTEVVWLNPAAYKASPIQGLW